MYTWNSQTLDSLISRIDKNDWVRQILQAHEDVNLLRYNHGLPPWVFPEMMTDEHCEPCRDAGFPDITAHYKQVEAGRSKDGKRIPPMCWHHHHGRIPIFVQEKMKAEGKEIIETPIVPDEHETIGALCRRYYKSGYPVKKICKELGISTQGVYYHINKHKQPRIKIDLSQKQAEMRSRNGKQDPTEVSRPIPAPQKVGAESQQAGNLQSIPEVSAPVLPQENLYQYMEDLLNKKEERFNLLKIELDALEKDIACLRRTLAILDTHT